jgi:5'-3' exoribonuclease 1
MGIPSYFSQIVKKHGKIMKTFDSKKSLVNNLYLDSNSIIYDSLRDIEYEKNNNNDYERKLLNEISKKIQKYIDLLKPKNTIYIAFDGVAPVAKLDHQRNRRYKSWFQEKITEEIKESHLKSENKWNRTAITPGTQFMEKLCNHINHYFRDCRQFGVDKIIVSASDEAGEGEHKIYEYIRNNPEKHKDSMTVIYGLDADLIMLTLNHLRFCPNMHLYRETPEFIKSIDHSLNPNTSYMMDIPLFAKAIIGEMTELYSEKGEQGGKDDTNCLYDYIFICFFLGNDFIPHFPAINIRTNGMTYLLNAYQHIVGNTNEYLTDGININWKVLRRFIGYLATNEKDYLIEEYKIRDRWEKRRMRNNTGKGKENAKDEYFMSIPTKEREIEKYINPRCRYWEQRYYKTLFDIDIDDMRCEQICINFLEAIEWTLKYYTIGCVNWRWSYKYAYPPLLSDLIKYIPYFDTNFVEIIPKNPVHRHTQLAYVLPRNSLDLLPNHLEQKILKEFGDKYRLDCDFKWSFCKYFWEAHVNLPPLKVSEIEQIICG